MLDLTFGEQVKIILSRRGMTIKELAEIIEEKTGKKMSRQNLTQRLSRDNFQEQDMRMIAEILGCPFQLNIMGDETAEDMTQPVVEQPQRATVKTKPAAHAAVPVPEPEPEPEELPEGEREVTVGEFLDAEAVVDEETMQQEETLEREEFAREEEAVFSSDSAREEPEDSEVPEERTDGEINPYTGREYETNSVRMHPKRIGYVQVYDQGKHQWVDMTEWAFLGYEERKKALMGDSYEPPIYLD